MAGRRASRGLAGMALVVTAAWAAVAGLSPIAVRAEGTSPEARAIAQALALLPSPIDVPVVPIDPELSAQPEALRGLDAFIVREDDGRARRVIYVNARADIVRRAVKGSRLFLAVLASVLHHEHQHLQGRDERSARRSERLLFEALMARGAVDAREGTRYLRALERQPMPSPSPGGATEARP
jgi:hypothetical protein